MNKVNGKTYVGKTYVGKTYVGKTYVGKTINMKSRLNNYLDSHYLKSVGRTMGTYYRVVLCGHTMGSYNGVVLWGRTMGGKVSNVKKSINCYDFESNQLLFSFDGIRPMALAAPFSISRATISRKLDSN